MSLERLLQQLSDPSDLSWKDETYDVLAAQQLCAADHAIYVAKLIELARQGDSFAILTLGHLHATEAIPTLQADANSDQPWAAVACRALVLLGKGADVLTHLANDALHDPVMIRRVAAILDLPKIGGPVAIAALEQALLDEDGDVRVIAWDALVDALGLTSQIHGPEGVRELTTEIEVMRVLLGSEWMPLVKLGASGMRETSRRLASGATPQQLGIAWRPKPEDVLDGLREAMYEDAVYPIDEIAALTGPARQLAETMIVRRLEEGDARVPDALVALAAKWMAPALAELATSANTPDELRAKLSAAASILATA